MYLSRMKRQHYVRFIFCNYKVLFLDISPASPHFSQSLKLHKRALKMQTLNAVLIAPSAWQQPSIVLLHSHTGKAVNTVKAVGGEHLYINNGFYSAHQKRQKHPIHGSTVTASILQISFNPQPRVGVHQCLHQIWFGRFLWT